MKYTILIALGLITLGSCKLAEPVGYTAYTNGHIKEPIKPSPIEEKIVNTPETTPTYTKKQLAEESRLNAYSIFNIPETMRMMDKRSKNLYATVDNWYGTPYRMGGTSRRGIDCSAFMQEVYGNVYKYKLPRTSRDQFATAMKINNKENLREGDLVFFKIRTKDISHVGIYLADGKFAHASSSKGVVISSLDQAYWTKYYVGGGRVEAAIYAYHKD